jgi:hypothetical protein
MLIPYLRDRKMKKLKIFDETFSVENNDRKESEEGKKRFQNKCVSSQNKRMRKEEGATVYVLSAILPPYLSQWAASLFRLQARPAVSTETLLYRKAP